MRLFKFFNNKLDQLFDLNEPGLEKYAILPYMVFFVLILLVVFFALISLLQWLFH